jgi:hypothetical protein
MNQYKIIRWDSVMINSKKTPVIYIKPDSKLLEHASRNNNELTILISETGTEYDSHKLTSKLEKSNVISHNECDYFGRTGNYVLSLPSHWYGYPHPSNLGTLTIGGMNDNKTYDNKTYDNKTYDNKTYDNKTYYEDSPQKIILEEKYKNNGMGKACVLNIYLGIGVILLIIYLVGKKR